MKKAALCTVVICLAVLVSCSSASVPATPTQPMPTQTSIHSNTTVTQAPDKAQNTSAPDQTEAKKISQLLSAMSLEEKVGQMFFVRCPQNDALESVSTYNLGGYILFGNDFKNQTKSSITATIRSYQDAADIPLLIGVDEEGGTVNRISQYKAFRGVPFHSPQELYREGGFDLVKSDTKEKAELLHSLGINVNLAPVCDVSTNPDDYIYARTFGQNGELTAQYVDVVVREMRSNHMGSVLKHFPGYGPGSDTHTGFSRDKRPYSAFETSDFLPFSAGIAAGAGGVLVCHNIVECIDDQLPASLSPAVHDTLRNDLSFDGVIMTDDLVMDAIKDEYGIEEAAVMAVLAGNNILLSTDFPQQIQAVIQAVKEGTISEQSIDDSVKRILAWKIQLGLI